MIVKALLVMLLALSAVAQSASPMGGLLLHAYGEVAQLGAQGANVTVLVEELNSAINFTQSGELGNATAAVNGVLNQLPAAESAFKAHYAISMVGAAASVAAVLVLVAVAYAKRREIVGGIWLRLRRGSRARAGSGKPRTLLFNEEVAAVLAAIAVVAIAFSVASLFSFSAPSTRFSAIGLLGPNEEIGDYPSTVYAGVPLRLYIYVYNHMEVPTWYVVRVYLLNSSLAYINSTPAVPPTLTYERVLLNNQSWIIPLQLAVNGTGPHRLLAQLWFYGPSNLTLTYTGNYVQLLFNSTGVG